MLVLAALLGCDAGGSEQVHADSVVAEDSPVPQREGSTPLPTVEQGPPLSTDECTRGVENMKRLLTDRLQLGDTAKMCANAENFKPEVAKRYRCSLAATDLKALALCGEIHAKLVYSIDPELVPLGLISKMMFGPANVKTEMGITTVLVEARNPTAESMSCTVSATFKKGDTILGVASGAVNDVPAGGKRTAQLITADSVKDYEDYTLNADTCFGGGSSVAAAEATKAAAGPLRFGKPTVKRQAGITTVLVEVTNTTDSSASCSVSATFKKGDAILAAANGAVNELPAGSTRTAQLMTTDSIKGYDQVRLEADTCF